MVRTCGVIFSPCTPITACSTNEKLTIFIGERKGEAINFQFDRQGRRWIFFALSNLKPFTQRLYQARISSSSNALPSESILVRDDALSQTCPLAAPPTRCVGESSRLSAGKCASRSWSALKSWSYSLSANNWRVFHVIEMGVAMQYCSQITPENGSLVKAAETAAS